MVRKFKKKCLFWYTHMLTSPIPLSRIQRREVCHPLISCVLHVNFGWLSTNNPTWLQFVSSNICNFFDLLSLPISCLWCATLLCRCSARRNSHFHFLDTNSLILIVFWCALCWYFLRFRRWENLKINVIFVCTHMRTPPHSCFTYLSAARYATHWFLVFGMWISGGYQRIIRHDHSL